MTDRELLLAAAKAIGLDADFYLDEKDKPVECTSKGFLLEYQRGWWNPLADDGDALRLAVQVGLGISIPLANKRTDVVTFSGELINVIEAHGDPYAATRRAIVRAVAEMGGGIATTARTEQVRKP